LLSDFAWGTEASEPKVVQVRKEDLSVSLASWGAMPFPMPVEDPQISDSAAWDRSEAASKMLDDRKEAPAFLKLLDGAPIAAE